MATRAAINRLTKEYKAIQANPPPYIEAHPSEHNILEWHYLLTGPPNTPYADGQYWGTLVFPPEYPFKPPAIRMMTPSGRFQTNTRLCLSISDFHPKSFNPAWEVSTILIGLLSFMTSEEMTTGSISTGEAERKMLAMRSRWWNSTGGGTCTDRGYSDLNDGDGGGWKPEVANRAGEAGRRPGSGISNVVRTGDGGERFRQEFPEVDEQNWRWMKERRVNLQTGIAPPIESLQKPPAAGAAKSGGNSTLLASTTRNVNRAQEALRRRGGAQQGGQSMGAAGVVVKGGEGWIRSHKFLCAVVLVCGYVLLARLYE